MKRKHLHRDGQKKRQSPPDRPVEGTPEFCTECGATLTDFCFSDGATNLNAVRQNLALCKKKGKFDGEFCAKLFIALPPDIRSIKEDQADNDKTGPH